jgi:hypothetical protein
MGGLIDRITSAFRDGPPLTAEYCIPTVFEVLRRFFTAEATHPDCRQMTVLLASRLRGPAIARIDVRQDPTKAIGELKPEGKLTFDEFSRNLDGDDDACAAGRGVIDSLERPFWKMTLDELKQLAEEVILEGIRESGCYAWDPTQKKCVGTPRVRAIGPFM